MNIVNMTPHTINLNDGRAFNPSGMLARVQSSYTDFNENGVARVVFGDVTVNGDRFPEPQDGTLYVVSGMVAAAMQDRLDVVSPATGHPDAIRNEKGHIVSVPGFVK